MFLALKFAASISGLKNDSKIILISSLSYINLTVLGNTSSYEPCLACVLRKS